MVHSLGLAIAKAFVTLLSGEIWLESQEGIGTYFHFTLPLNTQNKDLKLQTSTIRKLEMKIINTHFKLKNNSDGISRKLMSKSLQNNLERNN
jgi:hypothetical protein